jgi:hypothetical protein
MQRLELRVRRMNYRRRLFRGWTLVISASLLLCGGARLVAAAEESPEDTNKVAVAGAAGTNVTAIPLAEVAAQAEAAFASLQSIESNLSADQATVEIQQDLPMLTRESSARLEESSKTLSSNPSLQTLRRSNGEWQGSSQGLGGMETQPDEARNATGRRLGAAGPTGAGLEGHARFRGGIEVATGDPGTSGPGNGRRQANPGQSGSSTNGGVEAANPGSGAGWPGDPHTQCHRARARGVHPPFVCAGRRTDLERGAVVRIGAESRGAKP